MDGAPDVEGRNALKEVVTRRVSAEVFSGTALEEVIALSGGLLRDLVRLVRDAALIALTEGKATITSEIVHQVAAEVGNDYRRLLTPEHYDALKKAQQSKQISSDESMRQLLENLSLLEYRNTITWCDVHPIVRTLLTLRETA
jgi:Cdc6-like AAA superfamily ATPase